MQAQQHGPMTSGESSAHRTVYDCDYDDDDDSDAADDDPRWGDYDPRRPTGCQRGCVGWLSPLDDAAVTAAAAAARRATQA